MKRRSAHPPAHPPKLAAAILRRLLPPEHRDAVLAELEEGFERCIRRRGRLAGACWFWLEVVGCRPLRWLRLRRSAHPKREPRRWLPLHALALDMAFAVRQFRQRPGVPLAASLTLAFAIGANIAVFSVFNRVLIEDLPYRDPDRLVAIWNRLPTADVTHTLVSGPDFIDYRERATALSAIAGVWIGRTTLTGGDRPEHVTQARVTENFFEVLGVGMSHGRGFRSGEGTSMDFTTIFDPAYEPSPGAVVLSEGLFQRRFGGDTAVIGRTVHIDGGPAVIVGVLPAGFQLHLPAMVNAPAAVDIWEAFRSSDLGTNPRGARWLTVVARMGPGATLDQARSQLDAIASRLRETFPEHARSGTEIRIAPLHGEVVANARPVLFALLGSTGVVFLIACANVAGLLLVRGFSRRSELAVRSALGAGRGRIVSQLLTESVVIAASGSAAGLLVAHYGIHALQTLQPELLPGVAAVAIDARLVLFTVGLGFSATLLFGLIPALQLTRGHIGDTLRERARTHGVEGRRLRSSLIVSQIALSVALLFGASLLAKTLRTLQGVELGFNPSRVVTARIAVPQFAYPTAVARARFFEQLGSRLGQVRSAEVVGGIASPPLAADGGVGRAQFLLEGEDESRWESNRATYVAVLPGLFAALEIPLKSGRLLTAADTRPDAPHVVLVDESFAQRAWPEQTAVGQRLRVSQFDAESRVFRPIWVEVVGVLGPVRHLSLRQAETGAIYATPAVWPWQDEFAVVARSVHSPEIVLRELRDAVASLDGSIPVANARTMRSYVAAALAPSRFMTALVSVFAVGAVVLATLGLYAVIAFAVRLQTREIGIRIAFGAAPTAVRGLVVRRGLALAGFGTAAGALLGVLLADVLRSQLVGVSSRDPATLLAVCAGMMVVALAATYVPATRAARIDPIRALVAE